MKRFFSFGREAVDQHKGHSDKICRRRGLSVEQLEPRQLLALTGGTDSFAYFLDEIDDANVALTMPTSSVSTAISTVIGETSQEKRQKWTSDWTKENSTIDARVVGQSVNLQGQGTAGKI